MIPGPVHPMFQVLVVPSVSAISDGWNLPPSISLKRTSALPRTCRLAQSR